MTSVPTIDWTPIINTYINDSTAANTHTTWIETTPQNTYTGTLSTGTISYETIEKEFFFEGVVDLGGVKDMTAIGCSFHFDSDGVKVTMTPYFSTLEINGIKVTCVDSFDAAMHSVQREAAKLRKHFPDELFEVE